MSSQEFRSFIRHLDDIRDLAISAYEAAVTSSGIKVPSNLTFSSKIRERAMVVALLENPDMTVGDFYLLRRDYERNTGLYSSIQLSDLGIGNTNPVTHAFIQAFYNTVRGSDVTSG